MTTCHFMEGCVPNDFLNRSSEFMEILLCENCFHVINSPGHKLMFLHLGVVKIIQT